MKDKEEFFQILADINGKDYAEYGRILGDFDFGRYFLKLSRLPQEGEHLPALFIVRVPQSLADFPPHLYSTPIRRTALEDLLTRKVSAHVDQTVKYDDEGVAYRRFSIARPGQTILPRTAIMVTDEFVEARLYIDLPARRGRVLGEAAQKIFFEDLPVLVNETLLYCNLDEAGTDLFVNQMEDADQVRRTLPTRGLISFVAEGAMLARRHASDEPDYEHVSSLTLAEDLRMEIEVANAGVVRGLGIPSGITVILGDDSSGRYELMRAIAAGIYNHVPGDGREMVITMPDAVYVAAERNRSVQRVDISAFFTAPGNDARCFTTTHAGDAVSQAAAAVEALEVGARALLFDELDSAPGFLSQDSRLSGLLSSTEARSFPLSVRARQLVDELGISMVIAGGSSVAEFLPAADTVLRISRYHVTDVTKEAKAMSMTVSRPDQAAELSTLATKARWIIPVSVDPSASRQDALIEARGAGQLVFGRTVIDLGRVMQLSDSYQVATIGLILYYGRQRYLDEKRPLRELLDLLDRDMSTEGLECLSRELRGDLARPRRYEIAAALNRLRTLRVSHTAE